jgi:hypothetical protein
LGFAAEIVAKICGACEGLFFSQLCVRVVITFLSAAGGLWAVQLFLVGKLAKVLAI